MATKAKTLEDLFHDTLKDIYYAERQILRNLKKLEKAASSEEMKAAFRNHRGETEGQIDRLQQVFEMIGKRAQGKTCDAIKGIMEEAEEIIEDYEGSDALDAGLLAAAQAIEHYEITRYGSLRTWANRLGLDEAAELLEENLAEEKKTDQLLTELAEAEANPKAEGASS
jgi:ferritin-like metal-binding protein YciE